MPYRLLVLLICFSTYPVFAAKLSLVENHSVFLSGSPIQVDIKDAADIDQGAWLGMFKQGDKNLRNYLSYQYLKGAANKRLTFVAPKEAGQYQFKLLSRDYTGKEYAQLTFTVEQISQTAVRLSTDKTAYKPTESIQVTFGIDTPPAQKAWIGLFPAEAPHNSTQNYLTYQYVKGKSQHTFRFVAPEKPGQYELRFFDNEQGNEIQTTAFRVNDFTNLAVSVTTDKKDYAPQTNMVVDFVAHKDFPSRAWIGIFKGKVDDDRRDYLDYRYINKQTKGRFIFKTPITKDAYHVKMFSSESGAIVASTDFTVNASLNAETLKQQIDKQGKASLYGIYFDLDKSTIRNTSHPTLQAVGNLLKTNPELAIQIQGHTDDLGEAQYNLKLSEQRASAVKQYLIKHFAITPTRLTSIGFGETKPVTNNKNDAERALNRRVDIVKM